MLDWIGRMEPKDWMAFYGAALSTVLACVKFFELYWARFRVEVSYNFTGNAEEGNEIIIRNLTGKPVILAHWELWYYRGLWPVLMKEPLAGADAYAGDTRIDSHSSHRLLFCDENHFGWGQKQLKGRRIMIKLYFAGNVTRTLKVYPK